MPDADDQQGSHDVEVDPGLRLHPGAAKRIVDVVSDPVTQRNVPTSPETSDGGRLIRPTEILRQLDSKELCGTQRDIRIAGEVIVDLQCVGIEANEKLQAGKATWLRKDRVNHPNPHNVRKEHLLEHASTDSIETAPHLPMHQRGQGQELWEELSTSNDRSCHQLRKERKKGDKAHDAALGFFVPRDIDHIGQGLKCEE